MTRFLTDLCQRHVSGGYNYAWFQTVILQRIHGIKPTELAEAREARKQETREAAALRAANKRAAATVPNPEQPTLEFAQPPTPTPEELQACQAEEAAFRRKLAEEDAEDAKHLEEHRRANFLKATTNL